MFLENPLRGEGPVKTFDMLTDMIRKPTNWTTEQPLPTSRHGISPVDDKIHVIAGGNKSGLSVSNVNEVVLLYSSK